VQEGLLDLCFFFNKRVNCERYVQVVLGQFFSELTEEERLCGLFQQDSATAHTARMSMQALSNVFRDRIVSSDIFPACSPDLKPYDFFFWGCLKDIVYSKKPSMRRRTERKLSDGNFKYSCRASSEGKSKPLPPV
jgi:hypothetical protein